MAINSFLTVGKGTGPKAATVFAVAGRPRASISLTDTRAAAVGHRNVAVHPGVVMVRWREATEAQMRACLRKLDAKLGIALVVRKERVELSREGFAALSEPKAIIKVLARHVKASKTYNEPPLWLPLQWKSRNSMHENTIAAIKRTRGDTAWVPALFVAMRRYLKGQARTEWFTLLDQELPKLMGHSFAFDAHFVDELARIRLVSDGSIPKPPAYVEAQALTVKNHNRPTSDEAAGLWETPHRVKEMLAATRPKPPPEFERSFSESSSTHVQTVLALSHVERVKLCAIGMFHTRLANSALSLMIGGNFRDAMFIYDAVLAAKRRHHPDSMANPLYAVQNDNNHLGVDAKRAKTYLAVTLEYAPQNPVIYLNASGVYAELGDGENTISMLEHAKANGVDVRKYQNDKPYTWLRTDAKLKGKFAALMR